MYINSFTFNSTSEYELLEKLFIKDFKGRLPQHIVQKHERIYLLFSDSKFLKKSKVIGRCIVALIDDISIEKKEISSRIYNIPLNIMIDNPVVIDDFYIKESE